MLILNRSFISIYQMTTRRNADQKSQVGSNAAWDPLELCREGFKMIRIENSTKCRHSVHNFSFSFFIILSKFV